MDAIKLSIDQSRQIVAFIEEDIGEQPSLPEGMRLHEAYEQARRNLRSVGLPGFRPGSDYDGCTC